MIWKVLSLYIAMQLRESLIWSRTKCIPGDVTNVPYELVPRPPTQQHTQYAAVAPKTPFPPLSVTPTAKARAKTNVATETVTKLVFVDL